MFAMFARQTLANGSHNDYCLVTQLKGHTGKINCFSFMKSGEFLTSGGDNGTTQIWALCINMCSQVLQDYCSRWGQITCIKWLGCDTDAVKNLCFGTGHGLILIYQQTRAGGLLVELSSTVIFKNNSIEAFAYDPVNHKLAVTSHSGNVQVSNIGKNGVLQHLWKTKLGDTKMKMVTVIPRAVHYIENYRTLVVFGLETGEVHFFDSGSPNLKHSKLLKSGIGNASMCSNEKFFLVDNLCTGFDLYNLARTSPIRRYPVPTSRHFVKAGVFAENSSLAVCGSDHGKVYIFEVGSSETTQVLQHGNDNYLVQAIEAFTSADQHLIVSGSSGDNPNICVWARSPTTKLKLKKSEDGALSGSIIIAICNTMILLLLLWLLRDVIIAQVAESTKGIFVDNTIKRAMNGTMENTMENAMNNMIFHDG